MRVRLPDPQLLLLRYLQGATSASSTAKTIADYTDPCIGHLLQPELQCFMLQDQLDAR